MCTTTGYKEFDKEYAGSRFNFPEMNCCACGKNKNINAAEEKPSIYGGECTHLPVESKSKVVVEYCKVRNKRQCLLGFPKVRDDQCVWNSLGENGFGKRPPPISKVWTNLGAVASFVGVGAVLYFLNDCYEKR